MRGLPILVLVLLVLTPARSFAQGSITGVVLGSAIVQLLINAITLMGIPSQLQDLVIGSVILAGVIVDEMVKRIGAARRAAREARLAAGDDA